MVEKGGYINRSSTVVNNSHLPLSLIVDLVDLVDKRVEQEGKQGLS